MRAIFCIDPGGHSGVAWGIVDETAPRAIDAVRNRIQSSSVTVEGTEPEQIRDLYSLWIHFKRHVILQGLLSPEQLDLVMEDFTLRGGQNVGGKEGTMPERVAWGFEGYRMGRADEWGSHHRMKHYTPITWQQPGAAARYWKKPILEDAGAWLKGKKFEHERSAYGHMLLRVNILMDNRKFKN